MKLFELGQQRLDLVDGWQNSRSEVIGTLPLQESTSGYHAYAGLIDELQTVEHVRFHVERLGVVDRFLWDFDLRESVHSTLHWIAFDAFDFVQQLGYQSCFFF
jgi:hypothetical protein